jgi:hypothetical protein
VYHKEISLNFSFNQMSCIIFKVFSLVDVDIIKKPYWHLFVSSIVNIDCLIIGSNTYINCCQGAGLAPGYCLWRPVVTNNKMHSHSVNMMSLARDMNTLKWSQTYLVERLRIITDLYVIWSPLSEGSHHGS